MDKQKVETYLRKAAQDDTYACWGVALMYLAGEGLEKNIDLAIDYFERAAAAQFADAYIELALIYLVGEHKPVDCAKVLANLNATAAQVSFKAHYILGILYSSDNPCVAMDINKAVTHYQQARSQGHQLSRMSLFTLYRSGQLGILKKVYGYIMIPVLAVQGFMAVMQKDFAKALWGYALTPRYRGLGKYK